MRTLLEVFSLFCERERERRRESGCVCVFVYVPTCHLMMCKENKSVESTDFMCMFFALMSRNEVMNPLRSINCVCSCLRPHINKKTCQTQTHTDKRTQTQTNFHKPQAHNHIPTHNPKPDCTLRVFFCLFD